MQQKGFTPIVIIIFLFALILGVGFMFNKDKKVISQEPIPQKEKTDIKITSDNDKFRISDLYRIQTAIFSSMAGMKKDNYPTTLEELKNTSYGHFPFFDTTGKPYIYTQLENGKDYQLEATLDDGSKYIVYGNKRASQSTMDVKRSADLIGIKSGLKGYYSDKGYFPQRLEELIDAGWAISQVGGQSNFIPQDPATKQAYGYKVVQGAVGFMLTAKLDSGIELALRND